MFILYRNETKQKIVQYKQENYAKKQCCYTKNNK